MTVQDAPPPGDPLGVTAEAALDTLVEWLHERVGDFLWAGGPDLSAVAHVVELARAEDELTGLAAWLDTLARDVDAGRAPDMSDLVVHYEHAYDLRERRRLTEAQEDRP